jgi:hypothetical protein
MKSNEHLNFIFNCLSNMSSLLTSLKEKFQCFLELLVLSASRLRNVIIHPNSNLKVEIKHVEGETLCLKVNM